MNLTRDISVGALWLGLLLAPFFSASAQDACVGTWVFDPAASAVPPGGAAPTAGTLEIKNVGAGQFTAITETTAGGMVMRNEVTYAVDGKDYPFTYTPAMPGRPPTTQSIEQVNARLYTGSIKIGGQEMMSVTTEVSGHGLDQDRWAGDDERDDRGLRRRQDADTKGDRRGAARRLVEHVGVSTRVKALRARFLIV